MSSVNSVALLKSDIIIKKTYTLTCIFVLTAIFQWYFVVAYLRADLSEYSTGIMMLGFIMVTTFHAMPSLRHVYPYNYFFLLITAEVLILGAGTLSMKASLKWIISLTMCTLFLFVGLVIMGAILQKSIDVNPLCALTTFFFSFMTISMLTYLYITLETPIVLVVSNFITIYAIMGVIIFHSMVVHNGHSLLYHDDYLLLGLLLFLDFICLFVIGIMYINMDVTYGERRCNVHECNENETVLDINSIICIF